jgi:hypothetical protein
MPTVETIILFMAAALALVLLRDAVPPRLSLSQGYWQGVLRSVPAQTLFFGLLVINRRQTFRRTRRAPVV